MKAIRRRQWLWRGSLVTTMYFNSASPPSINFVHVLNLHLPQGIIRSRRENENKVDEKYIVCVCGKKANTRTNFVVVGVFE